MSKTNLSTELNDLQPLKGQKAIFLLGTDQYIGEGLDENGQKKEIETRVGIVPDQVDEIRQFLISKGVALDFYFLKGCGTRADFLDSAYLKIGGKLLFEHELSSIQSPHVVHALKEPTSYETFVPGPFMRIGALHSGAFDDESGVAFLFKKRNFAAIFDGSNIGKGRNIPIRGAMSVFAGEIAAEFAIKHYENNFQNELKIVISGGGVVGKAALNFLLGNAINSKISEIILIEPFESTIDQLLDEYSSNEKVKIVRGNKVSDEYIDRADVLLLTAFIKGSPAPNVIQLAQLSRMQKNSIIVDISIDEKGGIEIPNFNKEKATLSEVVNKVNSSIQGLGKQIKYIADDHMPKHKPKKASIAHGGAIIPYITILLYYAAKLNGSREVSKFIYEGKFDDEPEMIRPLLSHLRNGMAFYNPAPIFINSQIVNKEENESGRLRNFFFNNGIENNEFE